MPPDIFEHTLRRNSDSYMELLNTMTKTCLTRVPAGRLYVWQQDYLPAIPPDGSEVVLIMFIISQASTCAPITLLIVIPSIIICGACLTRIFFLFLSQAIYLQLFRNKSPFFSSSFYFLLWLLFFLCSFVSFFVLVFIFSGLFHLFQVQTILFLHVPCSRAQTIYLGFYLN